VWCTFSGTATEAAAADNNNNKRALEPSKGEEDVQI
jgi:hypothetical protein